MKLSMVPWWMRNELVNRNALRDTYFSDLPLELDARDFVAQLDERFDRAYADAVVRYYRDPPWDLPGVQLAICCYLAWGEIRSVDTFTRQAVELGFEYPRLRLLLSKQIYEEMIHHQLFRQAAMDIGGVDPLRVRSPKGIMAIFEAYDRACGSNDIMEKLYYGQFASERATIPSFRRMQVGMRASRRGLPISLERAFDRALHDEPGHVAVGRVAALKLAKRGTAGRQRMLELGLDIMAVTINLWATEAKDFRAILNLAGTLLAAKVSGHRSTDAEEFESEYR